MADRRSIAKSRKYGGPVHRRLRASWAPKVSAGLVTCSICGRLIGPADDWDLGHDDAGTAYRGPEHSTCNRREGSLKKWRLFHGHRTVTSREW